MAETDDINESANNLSNSFSDVQKNLGELATVLGQAARLTNDMAKNLGDTAKNTEDAAGEAENLSSAFDESDSLIDNISKKSKTLGGLLSVGKGAALAFATQLGNADKETTALGRSLNLSKTESIALKKEFAAAAANLGDINVNSRRLAQANTTLNKQLGTAFKFNTDTLAAVTKLTENIGISAESAASLAFQAQRTSKPLEEVRKDVLEASYGLQQGAGVALDLNNILEQTGNVTGQVRANLGANPTAIAKAVTAAKLFGAELKDIVASSKQLLNFESSIEAELEAELLTGKQLNLERARAAALAGDQETLARELSKNAGSFADFTQMNVLQQDALAKAMGMQSDQLADILFQQEAQGMNAEQLRAIGRDDLAKRQEELDTQKKITLAQENFQSLMADLSVTLLPIVAGFGSIVESLSTNKELTIGLVGAIAGLVVAQKALALYSLVASTAKIFGENAKFGPIGLGIAATMIAGMIAAIATARQEVQDGIAPPGGGPFTITDRFGATAITAAGDGIAVSPNINRGNMPSSQPIVIQNNWDAFQASNGNGRRGLGGTQSLQASPTFA